MVLGRICRACSCRKALPDGATMTLAVEMERRKRASHGVEARSADLLAWYDRHRRVLPWRAAPGERADPYRVWLSEIMLQQTTIKAVVPYFARFTARWPNVHALAAASLGDVLKLWAGLGYYARARHLHACAKAVLERHGGCFPQSEAALAALPGIGPYTAAATAAIAFSAPAAAGARKRGRGGGGLSPPSPQLPPGRCDTPSPTPTLP